jgi:hypothetical protein
LEKKWNIHLEPRAWEGQEFFERHALLPEPTVIEAVDGKLFCNDDERRLVCRMLLENLGLVEVVKFSDAQLWRQAISIVL